MDPQILLRKPKPTSVPTVTAKITKIDSLKLISEQTKKSSIKLRKIFEQGSYQKKTQLSILKRYKKKLDSLEKIEEERQRKLSQRSQKKFQLPKIKNFAGSFFTPNASDNPLKAIGLLAAFNATDKLSQKDFSAAIGPALVASGLLFGPGLLSLGLSKFGKVKQPTQAVPATSSSGNTPKPISNPSSLSRANQSYSKFISGQANIGDKSRLVRRGYITPKQALSKGGPQALAATEPGKVSKAFARFGGSIIPGVGAVVGATDSVLRAQSGDVSGSAIAGTAAALDAYAAASAATVVGLPLAGLASIASFTLDVVNLVRDLTGASASEQSKNKDRLKEQTKEQKKLVTKQKEESEGLTFSKTLNSYEKSIKKFEEFSKGFRFESQERQVEGFQETITPRTPTQESPYTGPVSGETFIPLPGATSIGDPNQGQNYGAGRGDRSHEGIDLVETKQKDSRSPIVSYKTGKVIKIETGDIYPGGGIEVDHGGGIQTRYLHVTPESGISVGDIVYGGQQIGRLHKYERNGIEQTHLHFEVYQNGNLVNPTSFVTGAKYKIPSPLSLQGAKKLHERSSQQDSTNNSQKMISGVQDPRNIQRTLSNRSVPFEVDGKKYFFRISPDGKVEAFKPKNLIGYQEKIDMSGDKNKFIQRAIAAKVKAMFPASTPAVPAARTPVPSTPTLPAPVTQIPASPSRPDTISQTMSYEQPSPYSQPKPTIVPIPIPSSPKSQTIITPQGSSVMMMSGPSEEELLNSFYKRVLLNTLV